LFAQNLAWSYFDHPPLTGWTLAIGQWIWPGEQSLRLIPLAIMIINTGLLFRLSRQLYPSSNNIAFWAVALFQLSLITQLLGWGMVPDVLLMTWNLLLIQTAIHLRTNPDIKGFLILGILIGLAGLTKYTAIAIPFALTIWLLWEGQLKAWLTTPALWFAVVIAAVMITPIFWWNLQNDWASFDYQMNHASEGAWTITNAMTMQLTQVATISSLTYLLGLLALVRYCLSFASNKQHKDSTQPAEASGIKLIAVMGGVHLSLVFWSSGNGEILPHWAAIGWLMLTPICAHELCKRWSSRLNKIWITALGTLSLGLILVLYTLLGLKPFSVIKGSGEALQDLFGWKEVAILARQYGLENQTQHLWVENWTHASRIAWYSQYPSVQVIDDKPNQFDLWYGEPTHIDSAILVSLKAPQESLRYIKSLDKSCNYLETYQHRVDNTLINTFYLYHCPALKP
jgi:4-amino-4-deoxy-L-arabinose transferase-like glycosyltransferase